jgi:hypothetical protein
MAKCFLYLVVIVDWVSRAVLAWRVSNTLGAEFCVDAIEEALARHGRPEIFNTNQSLPQRRLGAASLPATASPALWAHDVTISMDGKGRCMDNIFVERLWRSLKYEEVYLHAMRRWPRRRPALAPGSASTMPSVSTRALAIASCNEFTKKACEYVDDRLRRPAALPPFLERARKAGKCTPSPTYPQAPQPAKELISTIRKAGSSHQPSHYPRSELRSKSAGLHLKERLRLSHDRGPPQIMGRPARAIFLVRILRLAMRPLIEG